MSPTARYFAWEYARAFVWVSALALALRRATGRPKVSWAYLAAHAAALSVGAATDFVLVDFVPAKLLTIGVMQWVFVAPIVIFTVISLWICNWEVPVKIPDVLMTVVPIAAWGLMVIFGWQSMWYCHVLGAWFVSAASGGVDIVARYGPPWAKRRAYWTRAIGYAAVVMTVYLLLPRTE